MRQEVRAMVQITFDVDAAIETSELEAKMPLIINKALTLIDIHSYRFVQSEIKSIQEEAEIYETEGITAQQAFEMMLNKEKVRLSKDGKVNHSDLEDREYQIEWINLDTELCLYDEEEGETVYDIYLEDIERV